MTADKYQPKVIKTANDDKRRIQSIILGLKICVYYTQENVYNKLKIFKEKLYFLMHRMMLVRTSVFHIFIVQQDGSTG